jgi:hypothetical protein
MYKDVSCAGKLPKIYLDVQNPQQVFSPNMIDVFIGNPTNHMLIFTGVAAPAWNADEDYGGGAEVIINLHTTVVTMVNSTAVVGLASIGNGESDFLFSTDEIAVLPVDGNLELHACINVQGDPSDLNRISYQANVIVNIDEPLITGTIRWDQQYSPTPALPRTDPLFIVQASIVDPLAPGPFISYIQVGIPDSEMQAPFPVGGVYAVPYAIKNVPLNSPLYITVDVKQNSFNQPWGASLSPQQTSGPSLPITLVPLNMNVTNLDFLLVHQDAPK